MKRRSPNSTTSPEKVRIDSRIARQAVDSADLEEIKELMAGCVRLRELYAKVLTKELERVTIEGRSETTLNCPNYLARISDLNGYARGIEHAIKLLAPTGANLGADNAR